LLHLLIHALFVQDELDEGFEYLRPFNFSTSIANVKIINE